MPRRLKVHTLEKGDLELLALAEGADGTWEAEFEPLRQTTLGRMISRVPRSAFNHVLHGLSEPFVQALGLPPDGALQKLPSKVCAKQRGCPLHDKRHCVVTSKKLPWCYDPAGFGTLSETELRVASSVIFLWKEGVFVIAVYDD